VTVLSFVSMVNYCNNIWRRIQNLQHRTDNSRRELKACICGGSIGSHRRTRGGSGGVEGSLMDYVASSLTMRNSQAACEMYHQHGMFVRRRTSPRALRREFYLGQLLVCKYYSICSRRCTVVLEYWQGGSRQEQRVGLFARKI
jgi:hypothetical protein